MQIFLSLYNQQSVVALRLTCHGLEDVYQRIANTIRADQRERIVAPVREYLEFLDRFKLPDGMLRHPPSGGWPHIQPGPGNGFEQKTDFAVDILRHLSYIHEPGFFGDHDTCFAYQSTMVDYSELNRYDNGHDICMKGYEHPRETRPRPSGERHVITISIGWESSGYHFYIDTWSGLIYQEEEEDGTCAPIIMAHDFFEDRIKSLQRFDEVFVPDENVILRRKEHYEREEPWKHDLFWDREDRYVEYIPDDDPYDAEEMERQGEYDGTDEEFGCMEDADWIRHLYFQHGWPGEKWDKNACLQAIREFVEGRHERSGEF
jgi:hypothetical protein